ncbi:MAG: DUF5067 domain-containing protein [Anaerotruncus sp.]|nr:MAG: DUF5067 domain-containing protein [Anaerotruncus sp.]
MQQAVNQALDEQKEEEEEEKKRLIILAVIVGIIVIIAIAGSAGGGSDSSSGVQTTAGAASEATNSVAAQEKKEKTEGEIGDYICAVKSAEKCKNWEGKIPLKSPIISRIIHQKPKALTWHLKMMLIRMVSDLKALSLTAVQMNSAGMLRLSQAQQKKFQRFIFLRDDSTQIELEISELISFSDDKLTYTVDLDK